MYTPSSLAGASVYMSDDVVATMERLRLSVAQLEAMQDLAAGLSLMEETLAQVKLAALSLSALQLADDHAHEAGDA
ncbi:hypothetical protein HDU67_000866, partial [Dinochytrium kinnereticum]